MSHRHFAFLSSLDTRLLLAAIIALQPLLHTGCAPSDPGESAIDVMSFNIRYGLADDGDNRWEKRRGIVLKVFDDHRPGIAGLQEALRFQIDEILSAFPEYGFVGGGRNADGGGEHTAILYRHEDFELIEHGTFWLSDTPDIPSTTWGNRLLRICSWARLRSRDSNEAFYVYNTHFDHRSEPSRLKSAQLMVDTIARRQFLNEPYILAGDFNAGEGSEPIRLLLSQETEARRGSGPALVDTFRRAHPDAVEVGTFGGWTGETGGEKIDYVFTNPETRVLEAGILMDNLDGRYPSDHYPVFARLELRSP